MPITEAQKQQLRELKARYDALETPSTSGSASTTGPDTDESQFINQEQHPDISFGDRATLQNLANSEQAKINYLKQKGLDAEMIGSQLGVKRPEESEFKALDPQGYQLSDIPQDITDVAYDIPAGIATGLAGAAGGVVGNMPGAMAASGVTSAALEAARQKAGAMAGIPQEVSGEDVLTSGAMGASGPLLFGTGAGAAQIAKKSVGSSTEELAQKLAAQKGLVQKGYQKIKEKLPGIGEYFTGVPKEAISTYAENPLAVNLLADEQNKMELGSKVFNKIKGGMSRELSQKGKAVGEAIKSSGRDINISGVKNELKSQINTLKGYIDEGYDTPLVREELAKAEEIYNQYLAKPVGEVRDVGGYLSPAIPEGQGTPGLPKSSVNIKEAITSNKGSDIDWNTMKPISKTETTYKDVGSYSLPAIPGKPGSPGLPATSIPIKEDTTKNFNWNTLQSTPKPTEISDNVSPQFAFKLQQQLKDLAELSKLQNAGIKSRLSPGASLAEKQSAESGRSAYNLLNEEFDRATDGLSKTAKDEYAQLKKLQNELSMFKDEKSTIKTLQSLGTEGNSYTRGNVKDLPNSIGVDIMPEANLLQSAKYFNNPAKMPISTTGSNTGRALSLGGAGAILGYKAGGYLGGMAGMTLGNTAGSPMLLKNVYIPAAKTTGAILEGGGSMIAPYAPSIYQSTWNMMKGK